jgi:5-methylthioadenosine/S-adenosylhomocysteine deaminase
MADRLAAVPGGRILCAHLNDLDDLAVELVSRLPLSVAYCPRASAYFGHAGHRYRELRQLGANVCLGTDSIICLDTPGRISTLDDARFLMRRDGLPLADALAMATVAGARALGLPTEPFTLRPGPSAGLLGIQLQAGARPTTPEDAARILAAAEGDPAWILGPCDAQDGWAR